MPAHSRHFFHDSGKAASAASAVWADIAGKLALPRPARMARVRSTGLATRIALGLALLLLVIAVVGFFVVPPLAKNYLVKTLSQQLERETTIEDIDFNPFTLTGVVKGIKIHERGSAQIFASIDELAVNLEYRSILRWAPVLKRVYVAQPYLHVVRLRDGEYNFSDLVTRFTAPAKPGAKPSEPLRFALNNIQVRQGRIEFDDRPTRAKHAVSEISADIPFISNLPYYVDEYVQPAFSAKVNGTPVVLTGRTKPFKDSHETSLDLKVARLELSRYASYVPVPLKFKVSSGLLSADLALAFVTAKGKPPMLRVYGNVGLEQLAVTELSGEPLVEITSLQVPIQSIDLSGKRYVLGVITVQSPRAVVRRGHDGRLNWLEVLPATGGDGGGGSDTHLAVAELKLADGMVHLVDQALANPFSGDLIGIQASIKNFALPQQEPASVDAQLSTGFGDNVALNARVLLSPLTSEGTLEGVNLQLPRYAPYYAHLIQYTLEKGTADVSTQYAFRQAPEGVQASLSALNVALKSVQMRKPGEREEFLVAKAARIENASVDINKLVLDVGRFTTHDGLLNVVRESDGGVNVTRVLPAPVQTVPAEGKVTPWRITLREAEVDRWKVAYTDLALAEPVKVAAERIRLRATGLSNEPNRRGQIRLQAQLAPTGSLDVGGPVTLRPLRADLALALERFELLPLQPYFTDQVNILLTSGAASVKGNAQVALAPNGALNAAFAGALSVTDFASVDKVLEQDFLKWNSLQLAAVRYTHAPRSIDIEQIALSDFYSRIIISPEGRINLQDIRAAPGGTATAAETPGQPAASAGAGPAAGGRNPAPPREQTAAAAQASTAPASTSGTAIPPVRIGKVIFAGGEVNFTDLFIKPNYSANLTGVAGTLTGLSSQLNTTADVDLHARFAQTAPVEIKGKVNPLLHNLYLDIAANVSDIELGPFSPYSGKYVGYAIEKGKMSFDVAYKVENRKLKAENRLVLNQLTFGEKVQSPQATKLPVLLAVALLKDRNGVIDVNLPISGTIDDPKFSVGRIVITIIINLITKAVTAPFALIGSLFGGGGQELSYVEFEPGRAVLTQDSQAKLTKLQTALTERPGLKLDITGRADRERDGAGLQRYKVEQQVKAQKRKDLTKQGVTTSSLDEVAVDPSEYEKYLKRAYREAKFDKPRNFIGVAKGLPGNEMEGLMVTNSAVSEDDLIELANRRAQAAKDFITAGGKVAPDRVFLLAPKIAGAGADAANAVRADFALK
jgi:hypothetical protein